MYSPPTTSNTPRALSVLTTGSSSCSPQHSLAVPLMSHPFQEPICKGSHAQEVSTSATLHYLKMKHVASNWFTFQGDIFVAFL